MAPSVISLSITALRKDTAIVHRARSFGLRRPGSGWDMTARCGSGFIGSLVGASTQQRRSCKQCERAGSELAGDLHLTLMGVDIEELQREALQIIKEASQRYKRKIPDHGLEALVFSSSSML